MPRQARRKVIVLGLPFDSTIEGERYKFLVDCQFQGIIQKLEARKSCLQIYLHPGVALPANALRKASRQQAISYTPDFSYFVGNVQVAEDVKGKYGDSKRNRKLKRVGKPIVTEASHLRHKLYQAMYPHIVFRLVVDPELDPCATEGYF